MDTQANHPRHSALATGASATSRPRRRFLGAPHDDRAIEVFWHDHKLGYLPRLDNATAASLADRAHTLHAEIIGIDDTDEEWEPVRLRVWVFAVVNSMACTQSVLRCASECMRCTVASPFAAVPTRWIPKPQRL